MLSKTTFTPPISGQVVLFPDNKTWNICEYFQKSLFRTCIPLLEFVMQLDLRLNPAYMDHV